MKYRSLSLCFFAEEPSFKSSMYLSSTWGRTGFQPAMSLSPSRDGSCDLIHAGSRLEAFLGSYPGFSILMERFLERSHWSGSPPESLYDPLWKLSWRSPGKSSRIFNFIVLEHSHSLDALLKASLGMSVNWNTSCNVITIWKLSWKLSLECLCSWTLIVISLSVSFSESSTQGVLPGTLLVILSPNGSSSESSPWSVCRFERF